MLRAVALGKLQVLEISRSNLWGFTNGEALGQASGLYVRNFDAKSHK